MSATGLGHNQAGAGGSEGTPLLIVPSGTWSAAAWPVANTGIFVKFQVEKQRMVTGLRIGVAASSGNAKTGLFSSDGTNLTQLALSASTLLTAANTTQDILFTAAQPVSPFVVYDAFLALDNAVATILRIQIGAGGWAGFAGFDISYGVATQFVTPTTPLALSGLLGAASGYTTVIALI